MSRTACSQCCPAGRAASNFCFKGWAFHGSKTARRPAMFCLTLSSPFLFSVFSSRFSVVPVVAPRKSQLRVESAAGFQDGLAYDPGRRRGRTGHHV